MIEIETLVPLSLAETWERLTVDAHTDVWWAKGLLLEHAKGGRFAEPWKDSGGESRVISGTVTSFEPMRRLQFNYQRPNWKKPTRVEFLLSPRDGGTRVYLQHSGWEMITDENERRTEVDAYTKIWTRRMAEFKSCCAG